jgi:hypothetical protein
MNMARWSAPSTAEAGPLPAPGAARLRGELAALARDLRFGWTGRCLALTLAFVGIGYAVAAWHGLPVHWALRHLTKQAQAVALVAYLPLVLAYFADGFLGPRARAEHLRAHLFSLRFLGEFALAMIAVHVTLMMFVNLKQYVPTLNQRLWDSPLWWLDDALHLGVSPAPVLHELAASSGLLPLLDQSYLFYFPAQVIVPLLFLLSARLRPLRGRFFLAYCLIWMVGCAIYIALPALGPCYYRPSRFPWMGLAPYAQHLQSVLIEDYVRFRTDPSYYEMKLYYGVAALPSLHVGVLSLFAIATSRWKGLAAVLWVLTAVTFIGSMALAWHYAVDGYLGAVMAYACWWIAGRASPVRTGVVPRRAAA